MPTLFNTVRDLDRLRQIVLVLIRHGFGEVVQRTGLGSLATKSDATDTEVAHARLGERVRRVLEELGPSFIKLGQILSTRPDLIPEPVVQELRKLQEQAQPVPFDALRAELEEQLGAPILEVYAEFDETPLASASIAQVHCAKLRISDASPAELADVVVKIQRPKIRSVIERDMDLLYWLAHAVERSMPEARAYSPVKLVAEFDRAISAELDFMEEADHAERFLKNFHDVPYVRFPKVFRQASSRKVLTLEYLDGKNIYHAVTSGFSGEVLAKNALKVIVKQIFEDGFFHADPHPGNVIILGEPDAPVIAMIDLGLVGRLSPELRDQTVDLMVAAVQEDVRGMADALYALGKTKKKIHRASFEADVGALSERYLGKSFRDLQLSALVRDLIAAATRHGLEIPADFLMVGKTLMTIEGIGKELYPDLDLLAEVKPYFVKLMWQRYAPERLGQDWLRTVSRFATAASDMPTQVQEILDDLRQANLTLQVREPQLAQATERLGRRVFSGIIIASLILAGALLVATRHGRWGVGLWAVAMLWTLWHATGQLLRKTSRG